MDSKVEILMNRGGNEILASQALMKISNNKELKTELNFPFDTSFYSSVISHSYYAIFYSAKAYLISKGFNFSEQGQHQQVYYRFKKLAKEGIINEDLLKIYEDVKDKADVLLGILETEKDKRTEFTYTTIPQANKMPAEDSLKNAIFFISHIKALINIDIAEEKEENEKEEIKKK